MVRDGEGDRKQLERCHAGSAPIASKIRPIMGNDHPAEKPSIRLIHCFESNKRSFYDMLSRSKRDALWQVPSGPGQFLVDKPVDNITHSQGGGLQAHNYWDNTKEFIPKVADIVRTVHNNIP